MDIKELNEAISKALREDDFYDTFDALKIEIANDLDNGSLGNNDFELEAHIEGIDIKDLRKRFREIVLSGIAECVREGTNCMDAMEVLISKDSIKAEDFDGILEDLYNLFNKSDDEIEEIRKGKEINLYCNWSIELPLKESLNSEKKNLKEEMEYNRKIWDIFEENVAEYLNEHGVKPEGNNVMNYISKNAVEIVKAVLEKEYNYEEDDQAIFELYYNCPIHFTDKAQAIDKLLEEYLAESLKRCLTIEDKLLQISSLDKNESVTDKKSIKEAVGVSEIDDLAKDYFQPYMTYNEYKNGKYNAYMVWNTDLVYISEGGSKSEIIGASSKRELKGKIAAIRTYEYEKQYGRNEQVEPPTLAITKGLFKK